MCRLVPVLAGLITFVWTVPAGADDEVKALQRKVTRIARDAGPAVVAVYVSRSEAYSTAPFWGAPAKPEHPGQLGRFDAAAARKKVPEKARHRTRILRAIDEHDLADPGVVPESYGSGLVIDKTGLVLTCAHVVKNATRIYVRIPGKVGSWADVHAADPRSDLAVLKLLDPPDDLVALALGKGGEVSKGQFVVCLSNGYSPGFRRNDDARVDSGLVNTLRRKVLALKETDQHKFPLSHYGLLIETTAAVTPGCSGGTLLDLDGKVVGLTTALAAVHGDQPGGFAVPIDANTTRIVEVLKRGEEVEYGFLGVVLARDGDMSLAQVTPGSPAFKVGLRTGDRIVKINGNAVESRDDLFLYLGLGLAGSVTKLEVKRGRETRSVTVTLAKYYVPGPVIASKRPPAKFGLRVDYVSISPQRNPFWNWSRVPTEGVIVREVIPGSAADKARLQPDKVITHVNGKEVTSPADYYAKVAKAGDKVELTTLDSQGRAVELTLQEK
jgi:serine protease Do